MQRKVIRVEYKTKGEKTKEKKKVFPNAKEADDGKGQWNLINYSQQQLMIVFDQMDTWWI